MVIMKTCFLFPGQGAQYPGMAKDLYESSDEVKDLFKAAGDVLGKDMPKLLFEASEDELKITENTQAAVTLHNISSATVLKAKGVTVASTAGFSVGEYAALYEAGVLKLEDLFSVVKIRGEAMEKASRANDTPAGPSAMSAVIGLGFEEVKPIVDGLNDQGVFVANHSSPIQIVIAGKAEGLDAAETALDAAGAMKIVRLKVSGPFHSPLLMDAKAEFEERIAGIPFSDPTIPLYSNVTGEVVKTGDEAKKLAGQQIVSMVRWVDSEQKILDAGHERILECGPGKVLTGLWKSFHRKLKAQPMGTLEAIEGLEL
jgi:[acyl-carrier-protein] S-malonyltransferase